MTTNITRTHAHTHTHTSCPGRLTALWPTCENTPSQQQLMLTQTGRPTIATKLVSKAGAWNAVPPTRRAPPRSKLRPHSPARSPSCPPPCDTGTRGSPLFNRRLHPEKTASLTATEDHVKPCPKARGTLGPILKQCSMLLPSFVWPLACGMTHPNETGGWPCQGQSQRCISLPRIQLCHAQRATWKTGY